MEISVAINALFAVMLAIFPGFLFRKCYYRDEFTKQFYQSKDVDKLLWNVFFSGLGILITILFVSIFKYISGLKILDSLNYENINKLVVPITKNQLPDQKIVETTYVDILTLTTLIYFFSAFFGLISHWVVRVFRLDVRFPLFRFKNYWYYYIHGGRILYGKKNNRRNEFTVADILCDFGGRQQLYKGIVSQYTINKDDNNLENIFLTEARALSRVKNDKGETIDTKERIIPGASFCIPYKSVLNMNIVYVYANERPKANSQFFLYTLNIVTLTFFVFTSILLFFDLREFGIIGFWEKTWCLFFSLLGLANFRLLFVLLIKLTTSLSEWLSAIIAIASCVFWVTYIMEKCPLYPAVGTTILWICVIGLVSEGNIKSEITTSTDRKDLKRKKPNV